MEFLKKDFDEILDKNINLIMSSFLNENNKYEIFILF